MCVSIDLYMYSLNRVHNSCHTSNKRQREKFIGSNPISCSIVVLSYPYAPFNHYRIYDNTLFFFLHLERNFKASDSRTSGRPRWIASLWAFRSKCIFPNWTSLIQRLVFVWMQRLTYKKNQNNAIFNWFNKIKLIQERRRLRCKIILLYCLLCFVLRSARLIVKPNTLIPI